MLWEERPVPESWLGSFSPTNRDRVVICIKHDDQRFCKNNLTTHIHKGGEPNEAAGIAGHDMSY